MQRGTNRWRRSAAAAVLIAAMAGGVAACGSGDDGGDDGAAAGGEAAPGAIPALSDKPVELSFLWFEWPPAQALEDFANAEYTKERPERDREGQHGAERRTGTTRSSRSSPRARPTSTSRSSTRSTSARR